MLEHYEYTPLLHRVYLDENSEREIPYTYMRMGMYSAAAAALGRRAYLKFGDSPLYPNMYVILVGEPSTRKNTVISRIRDLMAIAGYRTFSSSHSNRATLLRELKVGTDSKRNSALDIQLADAYNKVSSKFTDKPDSVKDWLLNDITNNLEAGGDIEDIEVIKEEVLTESGEKVSQLYMCLDELVDMSSRTAPELFTTLNNLWDNLAVYTDSTTGTVIPRPTLNILGGLNPASFIKIFPKTEMSSGLITRVLLVRGVQTKRKLSPFMIKTNPETDKIIVSEFTRLMNFSGELKLTPEAIELYNNIYENQPKVNDLRFAYYNERRFTHLAKLAMLNAAMRNSHTIERGDVLYTNTILTFLENNMGKALGDYELNRSAQIIDKIINFIKTKKDGSVTTTELANHLRSLYTPQDITDAFTDAANKNIIVVVANSRVYLNESLNNKINYSGELFDEKIIHEWNESS